MLKLVSGSIEKVKTEIKAARAELIEEMKKIRKKLRKAEKDKNLLTVNEKIRLQKKLKELEEKERFYMVSVVTPVRIGNLVINFKGYETFMKKSRVQNPSLSISSENIRIDYESEAGNKGYFLLHNLSEHFEGFQHIPEVEVVGE